MRYVAAALAVLVLAACDSTAPEPQVWELPAGEYVLTFDFPANAEAWVSGERWVHVAVGYVEHDVPAHGSYGVQAIRTMDGSPGVRTNSTAPAYGHHEGRTGRSYVDGTAHDGARYDFMLRRVDNRLECAWADGVSGSPPVYHEAEACRVERL